MSIQTESPTMRDSETCWTAFLLLVKRGFSMLRKNPFPIEDTRNNDSSCHSEHEADNESDANSEHESVTNSEHESVEDSDAETCIEVATVRDINFDTDEETNLPKKGQVWLPNCTKPYHYLTKDHQFSKNQEWCQVENCPVMITNVNEETVEMNSFQSIPGRNFSVSISNFRYDFRRIVEGRDGCFHIPCYGKLHRNEFEKRDDVYRLEKRLKSIIDDSQISERTRDVFKNKLAQIMKSNGNSNCITMTDFHGFKNGNIHLSEHQRIGSPYFNRNSRWCPPVEKNFHEYSMSRSFPAPIGIRKKDFCLPSDLLESLKELVNQIFNFENSPDEDFEYAKEKLPWLEQREYHRCCFCGETVKLDECVFEYKSEKNYMEICHLHHKEGFRRDNIYFGHGKCNRIQGGCSEKEMVKSTGRLCSFRKDLLDDLFSTVFETPEMKDYVYNKFYSSV